MLARTLGVSLALLALGGCWLPKDQAELIRVEDANASALVYTASIRGAYFKTEDGASKFCAEPPPDVALDSLQKLAAELKVEIPETADAAGKVESEVSSKVVQLAGRTQLILLARELLYRSCELSLNHKDLVGLDIKDMYGAVIKLVRDMGTSELEQAQAERTRAETELERMKALRAAGATVDQILNQ